jgi:predicted nucleotidyltransferase
MTSNIMLPAVLELLAAAEKIFKQFGVEFYLVGALARDIHLAANPAFMPQRKIKDIDIAFQFILILMMKKSTRKGGMC